MNNEFLHVARHLADVLTQENEALERLDFAAAVALTPAKEAALAGLTQLPPQQKLSPPLLTVGRRLAALAAENHVLLERAIAVQTRIVRIVARACAPPPEAQSGGRGGQTPARGATALALSTRA